MHANVGTFAAANAAGNKSISADPFSAVRVIWAPLAPCNIMFRAPQRDINGLLSSFKMSTQLLIGDFVLP
jgi:hypothetical protein